MVTVLINCLPIYQYCLSVNYLQSLRYLALFVPNDTPQMASSFTFQPSKYRLPQNEYQKNQQMNNKKCCKTSKIILVNNFYQKTKPNWNGWKIPRHHNFTPKFHLQKLLQTSNYPKKSKKLGWNIFEHVNLLPPHEPEVNFSKTDWENYFTPSHYHLVISYVPLPSKGRVEEASEEFFLFPIPDFFFFFWKTAGGGVNRPRVIAHATFACRTLICFVESSVYPPLLPFAKPDGAFLIFFPPPPFVFASLPAVWGLTGFIWPLSLIPFYLSRSLPRFSIITKDY